MIFAIDDKSWKVLSRPRKFYDHVYMATVELQFIDCGDKFYGRVDRFEKDTGERKYVVSLSRKDDMASLIHECVHLVRLIFRDRHIPFDEFNDESIAYYLCWWVKRLWSSYHKEAL